MIVRARFVVTMNGAPIANGAVVVEGNTIAEVGAWDPKRHSGEVIDLGECALLPGLINAHCHLDYTCLRRKIARQASFTDWIRAINSAKAKLSADDYVGSINEGFAEARRFGTTTIANLTAFPESIARTKALLRTFWFAELIDIRDRIEVLPTEVNLAPHAPYTASPGLFRRCEEMAEPNDLLLTTHVAESAEEMQMSLHGEGPLAEFLSAISANLYEADGLTPVQHLAKFCRLDQRWLLVHVNELRDDDFELLKGACVAHCPRSHKYFGHRPFQFSKLQEHGVTICLGTDSLASNDSLNLFAEMRQLRKTVSITPEQILETVTTNPAKALQMENALGRLRSGHLADLIAVPFRGQSENLFDEILEFGGEIPWSMIGGVQVRNA